MIKLNIQKQVIIFLLLFFFNSIFANEDRMEFVQGFNKVIQRGNFTYHSPHPEISKSLLVRAKKEEMIIEWQTETIPSNYSQEYVSFIWYFGISQNSVNHYFDLQINDKSFLKFKNELGSKTGTWETKGINNSVLTLKSTMSDKYNDLMGIAILKIHKDDVILGEPLNIKVFGEDAESYAWYMTFQGKVNEELKIIPTDILAKGENVNTILYKLSIVHLDNPGKINVTTDSEFKLDAKIATGFNTYIIDIPIKFVNKKVTAKIKINDNEVRTETFNVKPVKEWEVDFVMHSHTDIGYTRPQTEILPEHLRYIDYALDFCDLTDNYPEEAKFRWTCETTWAVKEYLKSRPQSQIDRLKKRIEEGRIELTGMLYNISEIPDESLLASMLKPVKEIRESGLKINTAMQNDINGIGWSHVDYFNDAGIKYLVMGQHGHRALIPFEHPTVFWWESPAGNRILAYRTDHYMTGNVIGMHTGNIRFVETHLMEYLEKLNNQNYPYKRAHVQMSGYVTDNSPPSLMACNLIKEWNEKYEWPKLRMSTASDFIKNIEKNHGESLPVHRAAWTDWWSDGFGSAARETMETRRTQGDLITNKGLLSIASFMGASVPNDVIGELGNIEENLSFYTEHTFGADESISAPFTENTILQWSLKSAYVWDAVKRSKMLKEKAMGYIQKYLPKSQYPTIAVFNTLNWSRSGIANIYIDHQIIPPSRKFRIVDFEGNEISAQPLSSRSDGTYWNIYVNDIPPMGYKMYEIILENEITSEPGIIKHINTIENKFYKVEIDSEIGAISSILDKETGNNLIDVNAEWKFGQLIYEELSNRNQLERFTLDEKPIRTSMTDVEIKGIKKGPIWSTIYLSGKHQKCSGDKEISVEIRLYNNEKKIDLNYTLFKLPILTPEALYVAFPFSLEGSKIIYEAQGGIVEPGKDQIPGTSSDWNVIQHFASVKNENSQYILASNDIPLAHLGGLNIGEFKEVADPDETHVYSWVMNNYWVTNFRASQEGEHKWSYSITSAQTKSNEKSYKFGYENKIPFAARVFPEGKSSNTVYNNSLLDLNSENIILVSASPSNDTKNILLHLKEINGQKEKLKLTDLIKGKTYSFYESNVLGDKISDLQEIKIEPYETKFIIVELKY